MSISNNTTKLQSLMDKVNSLPTAENLDTELSAQDILITQIAEALGGRAVDSGSNANTCSVVINTVSCGIDNCRATIVNDDGQIEAMHFYDSTGNTPSLTLNNIVCGSVLYVRFSYVMSGTITVAGENESYCTTIDQTGIYMVVSDNAGTTTTITCSDDD